MNEFIITEIRQYAINADTRDNAIAQRKAGQGHLLNEQAVVNVRGRTGERVEQPIPRNEWPWWVQALATQATPADKGLGDVVARLIGPENSEAFKAWHLKIFKRPCGCTGRQAALNIKYPLHGTS